MCGFSASVDTPREPRRRSVELTPKAGRMQRIDREKALEYIIQQMLYRKSAQPDNCSALMRNLNSTMTMLGSFVLAWFPSASRYRLAAISRPR
jgi:hypothetical protein